MQGSLSVFAYYSFSAARYFSCVFIPALFLYFLQAHPYLQLIFTKNFTLNLISFFLAAWQRTHKALYYALIKRCIVVSKVVVWFVVCSHKVCEFVVMHSCTPNSDACTGLQYTHTILYQRTTNACLSGAPQFSSWSSLATLNHTRNVLDSRAVVQYAEHPYIICSFQVMHVVRTNDLSERNCKECLDP